jgi:nucleotide-binding universal stress UspA family protein
MRQILVPLDGSTLAELALPHARMLARLLGAPLHVLRVVDDAEIERANVMMYQLASVYAAGEAIVAEQEALREVLAAQQAAAHEYLALRVAELTADGATVTAAVRVGRPAETIAAEAGHDHDVIIVMATHGLGGLRRWALGSVADRVVHLAEAPVLLVRSSIEPAPAGLRLMVVPLDGSALSRQALPLASMLAQAAGARMLLLRSVSIAVDSAMVPPPMMRVGFAMPDVSALQQRQVLAELDDEARSLAAAGLDVGTAAPLGEPGDVIVDEATQRGADLIVMATHGRGGLSRWALGSVADKVLHATTTPLLVVRVRE